MARFGAIGIEAVNCWPKHQDTDIPHNASVLLVPLIQAPRNTAAAAARSRLAAKRPDAG